MLLRVPFAVVAIAAVIALVGPAAAQTTAPNPAMSPSPPSSAPAPCLSAKATETVLVPKGTPVVVKTDESYNSYSAKTGEVVHFEVVQDVIVAGHVIVRAGDGAEGAIKEGQAGESGFYGIGYKAANLRVGVETVHNFCGETLHVKFDRSEYRRKQGIFGSNKDVQVVKGQMYVPIVAYAQKICGVATTATPAPLPSEAIKTADH